MTTTRNRPAPPSPDEGNRPTRRSSGRALLRWTGAAAAALIMVAVIVVAWSHRATGADIAAHEDRVKELADDAGPVAVDLAALAELPAPVQAWISYTFDDPTAGDAAYVEFDMEGDFRRPLTEGFNPLRGHQVTAINEPALMFSGTTTMFPGLWAIAYDAYADGEMEMRAKVLSTITVVDEHETPELNQTSLQRWLLMSPLYPASLLPGGPATWEPVDAEHARATVEAHGYAASLLFTFAADGRIIQIDAEEDGDLTTPFHGAGEHLALDDYRPVDGVMLPHRVLVARAADGAVYPFFDAEISGYRFQP